MNKVVLMGRLTADPDIKHNKKEKLTIARFTLAVNFNEDNTDFIRCSCFGKTAEIAEDYLSKGMRILIDGRWHTGQYENDDGETVYTNECIVNRFEFCESRKDVVSSGEDYEDYEDDEDKKPAKKSPAKRTRR